MKIILQFLCLVVLATSSVFSQESQRIEIEGQIIVDYPDIDGVTVFNTSSNKGTITNKKGKFKIKVMQNDQIVVSALQFKQFTIIISETIIEAKSMTVFLVENVNKLDEILILPYGLSGDLSTDVSNTKTINPNLDKEYFGLANVRKYEFTDDYKSKIYNHEMDKNEFYNGVDFVKIVGGLLKPVFSKQSSEANKQSTIENFRAKYSTEYLLERLKITHDEVGHFVNYIEDKGFDAELLKDGNEFLFLDFLIKESKVFLDNEVSKD